MHRMQLGRPLFQSIYVCRFVEEDPVRILCEVVLSLLISHFIVDVTLVGLVHGDL